MARVQQVEAAAGGHHPAAPGANRRHRRQPSVAAVGSAPVRRVERGRTAGCDERGGSGDRGRHRLTRQGARARSATAAAAAKASPAPQVSEAATTGAGTTSGVPSPDRHQGAGRAHRHGDATRGPPAQQRLGLGRDRGDAAGPARRRCRRRLRRAFGVTRRIPATGSAPRGCGSQTIGLPGARSARAARTCSADGQAQPVVGDENRPRLVQGGQRRGRQGADVAEAPAAVDPRHRMVAGPHPRSSPTSNPSTPVGSAAPTAAGARPFGVRRRRRLRAR